MKSKYDKDGIEIVEDESQIGAPDLTSSKDRKKLGEMQKQKKDEHDDWERREGSNLVKTRSGRGYKPGSQYMRSDDDTQNYDNRNVNMGDFQDKKEDNPFQSVINFAKGDWNDKKNK